MIKKVLQFRWRILLIFSITSLFISWTKKSDIEFNYPSGISNSFFNEAIQVIKPELLDTNIILISGPKHNYEGDSIIAKLVQKISRFRPKVIAIDYDFNNPKLIEQFPVDESVKIVLAAAIDENDSILYPLNIFKTDVEYGHIMGWGNNSFFRVNHEIINSLPEVVLRVYDSILYQNYLQRENTTEIISYSHPNNIFLVSTDDVLSDNIVGSHLKNKIILIGKTGSSFGSPLPGLTDNVDVHLTPIGRQFGVVIIYNEIHTLLNNFINRSPLILDYSVILLLCCINIFIVLSLSHLNKMILYIITKFQMFLFVVMTGVLGVYLFDSYNFVIDYQSFCLTTLVSAELSFWFTLKRV